MADAKPAHQDVGGDDEQSKPGTPGSEPVSHPSTPADDSRSSSGKVPTMPEIRSPRSNSRSRSRSRSPRSRTARARGSTPTGSGSPNRYLSVRNDRKAAEMNVQAMANRLARLKTQQLKALKKVENTQQKCAEIKFRKDRNYRKCQMKYQQVAAEYDHMQQRVARHAHQKTQMKEKIQATKDMVLREKQDVATSVRHSKEENRWLVNKLKQEEHRRNQTSRDMIRHSQKQFIERKRVYKEMLVKTLEQDTQEKIEDEMGALQVNSDGLDVMLKEEARLLESLRHLNQEHSQSQANLRGAVQYDAFRRAQIGQEMTGDDDVVDVVDVVDEASS